MAVSIVSILSNGMLGSGGSGGDTSGVMIITQQVNAINVSTQGG